MPDKTFQLTLSTPNAHFLENLKNRLAVIGLEDYAEGTSSDSLEDGVWSLSFYRESKKEIDDLKTAISKLELEFQVEFSETSFSSLLWTGAWEEGFKHLEIEKYIFLPPGSETSASKVPIFVDPGAFGTGEHATTKATLELMESSLKDSNRNGFLDIGTGTGIFAAWAEKEGFTNVIGTDIVKEAIESATKTKELNNQKFEVLFKSFPEKVETYSVIACNILPPELYNVFPDIKLRMRKDSFLFIAGFNESNIEEAKMHCENSGFEICASSSARGWISFKLKLKN